MMNPKNRMENLTPPALLEKYGGDIVRHERYFSSIEGSLRTLKEGDTIELPKSITDTFTLDDEMGDADTTIGKIVDRGGEIFIQVIINAPGSPLIREFPATDPAFGLGELLSSTKKAFKNKEIVEAVSVEEKAAPSIEYFESITGTGKTYKTGDVFEIPSALKTKNGEFVSKNMKEATAEIGRISRKNGKSFIEIIFHTNNFGNFNYTYPADENQIFGLGTKVFPLTPIEGDQALVMVEDVELDPNNAYKENRKELESKLETLENQRQKMREQYWKLVSSLPIEDQLKREKEVRQEILSILRERGIDRIVMHGEKNKEGDFGYGPDFDVYGSLYLLNLFAEVEGIKILNDTMIAESVPKGSQKRMATRESEEVIFNIDSGGENLSIQKSKKVTEVNLDHHYADKARPTSATMRTFEVLMESEKFKNHVRENPWIRRFVDFSVDFDNLKYVDQKVEDKTNGGERSRFTEQSFTKKWPGSLYALALKSSTGREVMPFPLMIQAIKENRNFWVPYNENEIARGITYTDSSGEEKIYNLAEEIKKSENDARETIKAIKRAQTMMDAEGIKNESPEFGKFLLQKFGKYEVITGSKKKVSKINVINGKLAFIGIKALGYETYMSYDPKGKRGYYNSSTRNLTPVAERMEEICPGTTLVRGVMVFGPSDPKAREHLTEEAFLKISGIQ